MTFKNSKKKISNKNLIFFLLKATGIGFTVILILILIDALVYRSIYHPLTYSYKTGSWLICRIFSSPICNDSTETSILTQGKSIVVSSHHMASKVGAKSLQQGGNAIDAAVAVGYALAVTHPCCGNLGGGGFMLIRLANGEETFIDFRETAPLTADANLYLNKQGNVVKGLSTEGYLAVGVPGTVKGFGYALEKYGTMTLKDVILPSIELAEKGFILQKGDIDNFKFGRKKLQESNVAEIFLNDGKLYEVGDNLVQADLAKTLKLIAKNGIKAFYQGEIAKKIVTASNENNGILSLEDFSQYSIRESKPIKCNYRGYEVASSPPPGGGTTLCQMLNIVSGYDLKRLGFRTADSLHPILSSMLLAFGDRNFYLGDPNFVDNPTEKLLSREHIQQLREKITDKAIDPKSVYGNIQQEGTNTTHYSVVDAEGNAVAVTYTINSSFGAGVIAGDTGFLLNNEMDDFTSKVGLPNQFGLVQGKVNLIEPGKRPLSSMSPTIVTKDGKIILVTGSPGGSTIPTTVFQIITNIIDYGMGIEEAVNTPRIHYQGLPNVVLTEPNALDPERLVELFEKGYKIIPFLPWGAAESIYVDPQTNKKFSIHDSRKSTGKAVTE